MMMFLAGSGVSTLAHSTSVDLGAVFIEQTDVAIYVCQSQPKTCPPVKFISVQRENIGDSNPKTLNWMESIFFPISTLCSIMGKWFDPLASSHFDLLIYLVESHLFLFLGTHHSQEIHKTRETIYLHVSV